jgi:hypothetical protein
MIPLSGGESSAPLRTLESIATPCSVKAILTARVRARGSTPTRLPTLNHGLSRLDFGAEQQAKDKFRVSVLYVRERISQDG